VTIGPVSPIRTLFFESGHRGGSVYRLRSILERLDPDRLEGGLVSLHEDGAAARLFEVPRLFCRRSLGARNERRPETVRHPLGLPVPTPFAIYYYMVARRVIQREAPDVVYFNNGMGFHEPAVVAASRAGVPVVAHVRSSATPDADERRCSARVTRFVTCSRWGAAHFARELGRPARDFDVVYDGIDLAGFDVRARAEAPPPLPVSPVYVCLVGSLIERKRPLLAVRALALARRSRPELRLVVAGEGRLRGEVDRLVRRLDLEGTVLRLGSVAAVPALLARCHVGLLVSSSEGMPNAVMEYMAARLPVVSSSVPGVDELVEDGRTGTIVPDPLTPEAVADALCGLAADSERRAALGGAGRRKIERPEFGVDSEAGGVSEAIVRASGGLRRGRGAASRIESRVERSRELA
jgi:glycosyltransferase involved in cell wall biosynthesis